MESKSEVKEKQAKKEFKYPTKPKRNSEMELRERKTTVICNLRNIDLGIGSKKVRQYAIHYEPPIAEDNYPLKRKILRQLKSDLSGIFEKYFPAGDTLFVYANNPKEKVALETKVDETNYNVSIVMTSNYINCRNIKTKERDHIKVKSFVEAMIKHIIMANNHVLKFDDRSFFDFKDVEIFGKSGAKIWHGYSTAVCITESGLFLRVNDKNKMITGKTAYDKIKEIAKNYGNNMRREDCMLEIRDYFKGRTIIAMYGNFRAYRIGDVSFERSIDNTEFNVEGKDGKKTSMSVKNYYKAQYNIDIKNPDQPLLIEEVPKREVEQKTTRYLIPELVYLTGVDELEERDRADIIAKSKFQPAEKVRKIEKGLKYLNNTEKKIIKKGKNEVTLPSPDDIRQEWGITFGESFIEVEARCLPYPQLEFGKGKENVSLNHGRFRQKQDIKPVSFNNKNCMLITFNNLVNLAKIDCEQMGKAGEQYGVTFERPALQKLNSNRKEDLLDELKKINYNDGKEIAIVVLDRNTKSLYPFIKDYLYSQGGITSQFMLHDENPRGGRKKQNMSYYGAVLNQMVVKAQGELFRISFCKSITSSPSMLIGIDSTRTPQGTKYVLSASYNRSFNKFYTDIKVGNPENDKPLSELIKGAIDFFKSVNKDYKPVNIIIYRQSGNERQTEKLIKTELPQIIELLEGGYEKDYKPNLTVFGVNKKTELKFFEKFNSGYKNIPSGTVIDQKVVSPDVFEFYLQCPEVDRGTGSPVHFLCLYNTNNSLTINEFEEISLLQSYYYWNWPGPVRIPAALKYAEVANTFSSRNLKNEVIQNLKKSPYFI